VFVLVIRVSLNPLLYTQPPAHPLFHPTPHPINLQPAHPTFIQSINSSQKSLLLLFLLLLSSSQADFTFDPEWWDPVSAGAKDLISKMLVVNQVSPSYFITFVHRHIP
jgi:hypothetical protein